MKLDLLVFAAHPDDAELGCSGTILKYIAAGKKVGIVDLTRGELGTRGTAETRDAETAESTRILGLHVRENLGMRDGFFQNDEEHQLKIIQMIRNILPRLYSAMLCMTGILIMEKEGIWLMMPFFLPDFQKLKQKLMGKIRKHSDPVYCFSTYKTGTFSRIFWWM
jgi:hypothetical protein